MESELFRDARRETAKAVITGITMSSASRVMSKDEIAKSIEGSDPVALSGPITGLEIEEKSVPDVAEDLITMAAFGIVKATILYGKMLPDVVSVQLCSESAARGPSESPANWIIETVNVFAEVLEENNYSIGRLHPVTAPYRQEACVSAATATVDLGLAGAGGLTYVVAFDRAKDLGSADITTGTGVMVAIVENVADVKQNQKDVRGFLIDSKAFGRYGSAENDFLKPQIEPTYNPLKGTVVVSREPIIFGTYSENTKRLAIFKSLEESLSKRGLNARDPSLVKDRNAAFHTPYPTSPKKDNAANSRSVARFDANLRKAIEKEINGKEKFLPGFRNIETELEFISDAYGLYINFVLLPKAMKKRLEDGSGSEKKIDLCLDENAEAYVAGAIAGIDETAGNYRTAGKLKTALFDTRKLLIELQQAPVKENTLEMLSNAFRPLASYIESFMDSDAAYDKGVRKSTAVQRIADELGIDASRKLNQRTLNWYAAEWIKSVMSLAIFQPQLKEEIEVLTYGSDYTSQAFVLYPVNVESIKKKMAWNAEHELSSRKPITGEEYKANNRSKKFDAPGMPIIRDPLSWEILRKDKEKIMDKLRPYIEYVKRGEGERVSERTAVKVKAKVS